MVSGILDLIQQSEFSSILNGEPEITFFKIIFLKYTHFAFEYIYEQFNDDPTWGSELKCTLSKTGDIIHRMYLNFTVDTSSIPKLTPKEMVKAQYPNLSSDVLKQPLKDLIETLISNITSMKLFSKYSQLINDLGIGNIINGIINYEKIHFDYFNDNVEIEEKIEAQSITQQDLTSIYFFNPVSLGNLNPLQGTNRITVNQLLEHYDAGEIYLVYLFMDLYFIIRGIQKSYINNTFDNTYKTSCQSLRTHPINSLIIGKSRVVWRKLFAHYLLTNIYVDIGGNKIDQYDNNYYNIHSQLNKYFDSNPYQNMISQHTDNGFDVYIPLIFWFNKYNSLGLPVIALRYHDIIIGVNINTLNNLVNKTLNQSYFTKIKITTFQLITEYIYLSKTENLKFTTSSIEYLIEQTQVITKHVPPQITSLNMDLDFEMPCKELFWICQITDIDENYSSEEYFIPHTKNLPIKSSKLVFNNTDFGEINDMIYYSVVQPFEKHSRNSLNGINMFSFALYPENYQPSGSVNFSYLPVKVIQINLDPSVINTSFNTAIYIYAKNYNILKISNGFARLLYE